MALSFAHSAQLQDAVSLARHAIEAGDLAQAQALLTQVLAAAPDHAEALYCLAFVMRRTRQWTQAIGLMRKACKLLPDNLEFRETLGTVLMLSNEGRHIAEALECFEMVLTQAPLALASATNLATLGLRSGRHGMVSKALAPIAAHAGLDDENALRFNANRAIALYLAGDFEGCAPCATRALELRHAVHDTAGGLRVNDAYFLYLYARYLDALLAFHARHPERYARGDEAPFHVIGESHCLSPAHLRLEMGGKARRVVSRIMVGAKAYYFTAAQGESWQYLLARAVEAVPKKEPLMLCFGEIDCRAQEGIMRQQAKDAAYDLDGNVASLVRQYVTFVRKTARGRQAPTALCGIPAPTRAAAESLDASRHAAFLGMIRHFNAVLEKETARQGLGFVDVYRPTAATDGWARDGVHIDHVHLVPSVVGDAMEMGMVG